MKYLALDLETTGLNPDTDRIVQIGMILMNENFRELESFSQNINPQMPVSQSAFEIHGISDDDLKHCKTFSEVAVKVMDMILHADALVLYNGTGLDLPVLAAEFERCRMELPPMKDLKVIDASNIFRKYEQRTLAAAVKFYLNEDFEGMHDATTDATATAYVLKAQMERYGIKPQDLVSVSMGDNPPADHAGKLYYDGDGDVCWNIGKAKGQKVKSDHGLASWYLSKRFLPASTLRIIEDAIRVYNEMPF